MTWLEQAGKILDALWEIIKAPFIYIPILFILTLMILKGIIGKK